MLTMLERSNLTLLIEKCLLNPGQRSTPVRPQSWSNFNACSQPGVELNHRPADFQYVEEPATLPCDADVQERHIRLDREPGGATEWQHDCRVSSADEADVYSEVIAG